MKHLMERFGNRADLSAIAEWIERGSDVLDLGCGDGSLLHYLKTEKDVHGVGVEISIDRMLGCVEKGIPVVEHDLNSRFEFLPDRSFDYVILSQTIQEVLNPDLLMEEMLRVGRYALVSFPNFGYIRVRMNLLASGRMPKSRSLPFEWYNTPNIHLLTLKDFKDFCGARGIKIHRMLFIRKNQVLHRMLMPNLYAEACVALISA